MLIIKNANIYTMSEKNNFIGDIAVKDGKILSIGVDIEIEGAEIIDAKSLNVFPGFVEAHTHYGQMSYITGAVYINDFSNSVTPLYKASQSLNGDYKTDFEAAVKNGITTAVITPGSANVIGGEVIAVKMLEGGLEEKLVKEQIALKAAFGDNPVGCYGSRGMEPTTVEAVYSLFDDYFAKAKEIFEGSPETDEQKDYYKLAILALQRKIKVKIHSFGKDLPVIIKLCMKYNLDFTLDHANGIVNYIDNILAAGCGIILGPIDYAAREDKNTFEYDLRAAKLLIEKGISIAFTTDGPGHGQNLLLYTAAEAVRSGMNEIDAMKAITINAAVNSNISDRVGSIEVGKDADFAIYAGMPCTDVGAKLKYTIISGNVVYKE